MRARHAYRDLYDDDIDAVLERVLPQLEAASSSASYAKAVAELAASTNDPSGAVRGVTIEAMRGDASLPFRVRGADGRVLLSDVIRDSTTTRLALTNGTELVAVDGFPIPAWISEHARTDPSTNEWSRLAALLTMLPRGRAGEALVRVRDANNRERGITVPRRVAYREALPRLERPDGAPSRMVADGIAYVDVERLSDSNVDAAFSTVSTARGLILDLRGALSLDDTRLLRRLATRPRAVVARVIQRALTTPCLVTLREAPTECPDVRETSQWIRQIDTAAVMSARIVALVDERTQGAMERFALALEQMSNVTLVGSPTVGALSPATVLSLPGGLSVGIPTYEVRRADGSQVQRVGVTPTIEAHATVRGLRAGDDEVLTRAQQSLQQQLEPARRRR
jgi:C-terminal processing protease CtpA/Prc